jgi:3-deoxy-D-manno-octulosonic-acid transferase
MTTRTLHPKCTEVFSTGLYNLALLIALVLMAPVWMVWLLLVPKVRAGFWEKCGLHRRSFREALVRLPQMKRVWLHAVSVGEVNAARPLIEALGADGFQVVLSTSTATGQHVARTTYPHLPVFYAPFDFPWAVSWTLNVIQPRLIVVMETEIWPNRIWAAFRRGIPQFLVNGRLSQKSFRGYRRWKGFFAPLLNRFDGLWMQSEADAERMASLGADCSRVNVMGNLKFDLPPISSSDVSRELAAGLGWPPDLPVIIFASSHPGEEALFLRMFADLRKTCPDLRAVLAPRHPERADEVDRLIRANGWSCSRRSRLSPQQPNLPDVPLVLLDTVGELQAVFTLGTIACMGGTFVPWGGHNPLEPIQAGIPVVFGPCMQNFEAVANVILAAKAGVQVNTPDEAEHCIRLLLADEAARGVMVTAGQAVLAHHAGVAQKVLSALTAAAVR